MPILINLAMRVPEKQRERFLKDARKQIDHKKLRTLVARVLVQHFTTEELIAWTEFWKTKEGQSIMRKQPVYGRDLTQVLLMQVLPAAKAASQVTAKPGK